jgi:nucleotide-binding universal stress UspA family protein
MTTSRYKKIVVPLDGSGWSEAALPHAIDIARANNSEVILLHVFRPRSQQTEVHQPAQRTARSRDQLPRSMG